MNRKCLPTLKLWKKSTTKAICFWPSWAFQYFLPDLIERFVRFSAPSPSLCTKKLVYSLTKLVLNAVLCLPLGNSRSAVLTIFVRKLGELFSPVCIGWTGKTVKYEGGGCCRLFILWSVETVLLIVVVWFFDKSYPVSLIRLPKYFFFPFISTSVVHTTLARGQ